MVSVPLSISAQSVASVRSRREERLGHLQPFALDTCATWHEATEEGSVPLHEQALEELHVLQAQNRVVLLSAPRAGHGKTHLLGRVAQKLAVDATIAGVPWHSKDDVSWLGCGRGVLYDLAHGGGQTNVLQRVCAGVLATLLRRLVQTGRIPSTDPARALRVLSGEPMELFINSGNARVIGEWFRRHFDQLRPLMAEISNLDGPEDVEDWLRGFFEYVEQPTPAVLAVLVDKMQKGSASQAARFMRLITIWRPLVLVADHMDGLYRDSEAGVAVARMTLALASLPGVYLVLSVNQDLWDTTFGRQLPSALEDRLNAKNVTLRGISEVDAKALLALRLKEAGVALDDAETFLRFLDVERFFMGRPIASVSARGLLRHAAQMWRQWVQSENGQTPEQKDVMAAESFLMEPAPTEEEGLQKLADNLAADAGGEVVDLPVPEGLFDPEPVPTFAPAPVVATPPVVVAPPVVVPPPVVQASVEATPLSPPPITSTVAVVPNPFSPPTSMTASIPVAQQVPTPPVVFFDKTELSVVEGQPIQENASPTATSAYRQPVLTEVPQTTFHKLRQMLAKLKVATDSVPLAEAALTSHQVVIGGNGNGQSHGHEAVPSASALQSRYESLRQEIGATPRPTIVELGVISELIRLAGKRFPVVNYDEVELPGLLGRSLPRWTLSGMEVIFGLEDFAELRYWKTVSSYMAGRLAEIHAQAVQAGTAAPHVKLVVFKGDHEAAGLVALLRDETIPPSLRSIVDAVHLDPRSLASLYAMHQIVREAETGALHADTNAVLATLANELDFFWKRVTRPKI